MRTCNEDVVSSILTPGSEHTLARSIIRPAPSCASSGSLKRWLAGTLHDGNGTWTGTAFVDHDVLDDAGIDPLDAKIYVRSTASTNPTSARTVLDGAAHTYPNVSVLNASEFKASKASDINTVLNLIYALLGLAIVIALIGITNTLALSIFERTKELGLLRAIGMSRAQLRASVRWESMIIAFFGTALGISIGLFFAWSLVNARDDQGFDAYVVPAGPLTVVAAIAAIAGVVAALLPARRAARLDILGAIATQ